MKVRDVLRKLGIWRYGTKTATYTGMTDRPAEFMMDGVFNAEKDLLNREDVEKATAAVKSLKGRKVMFWAVLPLGAFASDVCGRQRPHRLVLPRRALWGGFIAVVRQFAYGDRYSYAMVTLLLVVLVFVSLMLLGAAAAGVK